MPSKLDSLNRWVDDVAKRTKPAHIHWCDGSEAEYRQLVDTMLETGDLVELNQETHPRCYLHRSDP
ncbi:MAG TPA: phosphoenolpyruvate carboxykinase, partial [Rhodanobacteraceae bacterium]|nr:phosphoenolpyruvate carboxykinase [Rhodanobacteraceae bacterium]